MQARAARMSVLVLGLVIASTLGAAAAPLGHGDFVGTFVGNPVPGDSAGSNVETALASATPATVVDLKRIDGFDFTKTVLLGGSNGRPIGGTWSYSESAATE